MKLLCEVEEHVEVLLRAHTVTTCNNDWSTLEVMLGSLNVTVENLDYIFSLRHELCHIVTDHFALVVLVEHFLLHHTLAHCSHLWTVLWVDDSCHDVTAEGRTDLIELLFEMLYDRLLVLIEAAVHVEVTDLELCTVGSKTAEESRRDTRTEVTADDCCTHEADLRIFLLEEVDEDSSVRIRSVREETWCIEHVNLVNAILHHLILNTVEARTCTDTFQLYAKSIGQLTALCEEFEADVLYGCTLDFAIYKYAIHIFNRFYGFEVLWF